METPSQLPNSLPPLTAASYSAFTMNSENSFVLTSNDLEPTKYGVKTGYHTSNGHISQIPGLSPTTNTLPEERIRGRRVGVLESDSDYVKLAKQGGHKVKRRKSPELLNHKNLLLGATTCQPGKETTAATMRKRRTTFLSTKVRQRSCRHPVNIMRPANSGGCKVIDKKPAPVDMSKLLSFGYAEDSKPV
ncbi:uncharacterized protein LOC120731167 isoform X3 [Simochromis diagramma]|uniref:uncharacterized protein LOC120731167 isoform X3 n=1 Tax=Simochromis diagramma TaxID=43689 RepID=UPI001A7E95A6|nr:uncharacterized protein LOC120731167 isoform X3 [Simochromis diagramma]